MNLTTEQKPPTAAPPSYVTTEVQPSPPSRRFLPVSRKRPGPIAVTALFSLGWVFMYADRNILSPVMSVIQDQWGLNKGQLGQEAVA